MHLQRILAPLLMLWLAVLQPAVAGDLPLSSPPPAMTQAGETLFTRMLTVNASVKTIEANVKLSVAFRSFPFIRHSLVGIYYYKQPGKQVVIFDTVPFLAKEFKKVYPNIDPPSQWARLYTFGVLSDENGTTTFRLVPQVNSRIEHLDVKVNDENGTISGYMWTYKDGGYVSFDQEIASVQGAFVVTHQSGKVELPAYKADADADFTNYRINGAIADHVFQD